MAAHAAIERRLLSALRPVSPVAIPAYDRVSANGDFGGYRMIAGQELRYPLTIRCSGGWALFAIGLRRADGAGAGYDTLQAVEDFHCCLVFEVFFPAS